MTKIPVPVVPPVEKLSLAERIRQAAQEILDASEGELACLAPNPFVGYCAFNFDVEGLESLCELVALASARLAPFMSVPGCWYPDIAAFLVGQLGTVETRKLLAQVGKEWKLEACPFSDPEMPLLVIGTAKGLRDRQAILQRQLESMVVIATPGGLVASKGLPKTPEGVKIH